MTNRRISHLLTRMDAGDWAWMKENWEGRREQVFTHHEVGPNIVRHIHVTRLWQGIKTQQVDADARYMNLNDELYNNIIANQGIERDHLVNISETSAAYDPALIVEFEHGGTLDHIIVDGNHKIVKAYEMGLRRRPALFIKSGDLEPYLVHPPPRVSELMKEWTKLNMAAPRV